MEVIRTIFVKAEDVLEAREIASAIFGGTGMFEAPRTNRPDGTGAPTHFMSSGPMEEAIPAQFLAYNDQYGFSKYDVTDPEVESVGEVQTRLGLRGLYDPG